MAPPDAVFKALADPSRREIRHLLRSGPRSSGEIAEHFPSAWPTISRHLAVLRDAKLVTIVRHRLRGVHARAWHTAARRARGPRFALRRAGRDRGA